MNIPGFTAEAALGATSRHYRIAGSTPDRQGSRAVRPQLQTDYTTRDVCKACGCTASDVACDCGTPPRPKKLECIRNGGPTQTVRVLGGVGILDDMLLGRRA